MIEPRSRDCLEREQELHVSLLHVRRAIEGRRCPLLYREVSRLIGEMVFMLQRADLPGDPDLLVYPKGTNPYPKE